MNYGSVCSGIEAATAAWAPLGWKAKFLAEVEPFPSAVLMERLGATRPLRPLDPAEAADEKDRKSRESWARQTKELPEGGILPNLGDFTKIQKEDYDGAIDLLVGGTPCQSYSLAGLRKGLADPRGNLALEFVRLAYRSGARWTVWENVPGVLSSGGGRDFASLLSLLCGWEVPVPKGGWGRCGVITNAPGCYGLAWRILDAQYTRVPGFPRAIPQRRRRIFLLGYRGGALGSPLDWTHPAAVLLDGEMRERDTPPRREAAQGASAPAAGGPEAPGERGVVSLVPYGMRLGAHEDGVASTIARIDAKFPQCVCGEEEQPREASGFDFELFTGECQGLSPCLGATRAADTMVHGDDEPETLRMREGCAGGGKGPLISRNVSLTLATSNDQALLEKGGARWWDGSGKADTLTTTSDAQRMPDKGRLQCVVDMRQLEAETEGNVSPTLVATDYKGGKAVVETPEGESPDRAACPTLEANLFNKSTFQDCDKLPIERDGDGQAVCFQQNQRDEVRLMSGDGAVAGAVCAVQATKNQNLIAYENHPNDSRVKEAGDVSPTLTSRLGTGGGNTPLVQEVGHPRQIGFIKNDAGGDMGCYGEEVFPTLRSQILPAVAQRECFSITPCDANGTRKDRPDGGLYVTSADASKTLTHGNPNTETVVVEPEGAQTAFSKTARPTEAGGCPNFKETGVANTLNLWDRGESRANELVVVEPPVISLDGDKMGKAERAGGSGLGVNGDDLMYTQTTKDVHGVAYAGRQVGCDLYNGKETGDVSATVMRGSCTGGDSIGPSVIKVDTVVDMMGGKSGCHVSKEDVSPTLATTHGESHAVAYGASFDVNYGCPVERELAHTQKIGSGSGYTNGVMEAEEESQGASYGTSFDVNYGCPVEKELAHTQTNGTCPGHHSGVMKEENPGWRATVRRLLPVETERLMGFPDGWTQIPWKGRKAEDCPDAPRYKACGNSMAINVMRWIGIRIQQEEEKIQEAIRNENNSGKGI